MKQLLYVLLVCIIYICSVVMFRWLSAHNLALIQDAKEVTLAKASGMPTWQPRAEWNDFTPICATSSCYHNLYTLLTTLVHTDTV